MDSSTTSARWSGALVVFALLLSGYVAGYGALRWRKLLVRHEYRSFGIGIGPCVTEIRAGHDLRSSGVGAFKNRIATPLAHLYFPLRWIEASLRMSNRDLSRRWSRYSATY